MSNNPYIGDHHGYQKQFEPRKDSDFNIQPDCNQSSSRPADMPDYASLSNSYKPPPPPPYPPPSNAPGAKPIADAVNQAFDNSTAANDLPANVIAQITEQVRSQVIDTLRKELSGSASVSTASESQQSQQSLSQSYPFDMDRDANVPTLAIPTTQSFGPGHPFSSGPGSNMPQNSGQYYGSSPSKSSQARHTPPTPEREYEDSTYFGTDGTQDKRHTKRISQESASSRPIPMPESVERKSRQVQEGLKEDLSLRYGERTRDDLSNSSFERPAPSRVRTNDEETVIEKMWQPLFEANGKPTSRANQFLKGIALQLIEEFEPKNSLVVGPHKMKRYFEQMNAKEDLLPWKEIFMLPSKQLSNLYSKLSCQHHFIPRSATPYETPCLAALTPQGFASFMTILIQAYPDVEFQRLSATVREWPVSNADERKERWPKELSRRLLPKQFFEYDRRALHDALRAEGIMVPQQQASQASQAPPTPQHSGGSPVSASQGYSASAPSAGFVSQSSGQSSRQPLTDRNSRRKSNYAGPSVSSRDHADTTNDHSSDDSSTPSASAPLERERKPYVAREGSGKVYEEPLERVRSTNSVPFQHQPTTLNTKDRYTSQQPSSVTPQYIPTPTSTTSGPSRTRERGASTSQDAYHGRDSQSQYQHPHARSPAYGQPVYTRGTEDWVDGTSDSSSAYYDERYNERDRDRDRLSRVTSRHEDERERDRRYVKHDEDYRRSPGMSNTYAGGNPPLGTGERRY